MDKIEEDVLTGSPAKRQLKDQSAVSARLKCAEWAHSLWASGLVPESDREQLGSMLRLIASGEDARIAFGVRSKGRPSKLSISPLTGDAGGAQEDACFYYWAPDETIVCVPVEEALTIAIRGDTKQAQYLVGLFANSIEQRKPLPVPWNWFLAKALHGIANGQDARRSFFLVRPPGNRTNPLRDRAIARIGALSDELGWSDRATAIIADSLGLTKKKGRDSRLTAKGVKAIRNKVP